MHLKPTKFGDNSSLPTKEIDHWLKQQSQIAKSKIRSVVWLGNFNTLLVVAQAYILASIIEKIINATNGDVFLWNTELLAFGAVILLRAIATYLKEFIGFKAGKDIREKIRLELVNKMFALGPSYTNQFKAGNLSHVIVHQVEAIQEYYARYVPQLKLVLSTPIIILIFVFPLNWLAALILMLSAPLIPLFIVIIGKKAKQLSLENFVIRANLSAHFLDILRGFSIIKLLGQTQNFRNQVAEMSKDYRLGTIRVLKVAFLTSGVLELFSSLAIVLVAVQLSFAFGADNLFNWQGNIGLKSALFILILTPEFYQAMRDFSTFYHARADAVAGADSILKILSEDEVYFPKSKVKLKWGKNLKPPAIEFNNLNLTFAPSSEVLVDLDCYIKAGEKVGIVGESGSGKSTLINLLLGNLIPTSGEIKVGNQQLSEMNLSDYRAQLVWLGQNPNLVHGTIEQNLRLANTSISRKKMKELLEKIAITNEDETSSKINLQTTVYEDGAGLSGGQLQRIALARALLKPSKIMFLDEPTAHVDMDTEKLIVNTLKDYWQNKTVVMATHREAFLPFLDKIMVLESGKIAFFSTYKDFQLSKYSAKLFPNLAK